MSAWKRPNAYTIDVTIKFVTFLHEKGYIQNNQISTENVRNHFNFYCKHSKCSVKFVLILRAMIRLKIIRKKKPNQDNTIVNFKSDYINKIRIDNTKVENPVNTSNGIDENKNATKKKSSPKKTTLVSQRVALPSKHREQSYISVEKCDICNCEFNNVSQYESHLEDDIHILRNKYRTNRKELMLKNKDIIIETDKEEGAEKAEIESKIDSNNSLIVKIKNKSEHTYEISQIILLYNKLQEISLTYTLPIIIQKNSSGEITAKFSFKHEGVYLLPIIFRACNKSQNKTVDVLKELVINIQSEFVNDLKPVSPYKRRDRAVISFDELRIIDGEKPPKSLRKEATLSRVIPLEAYHLPKPMIRILNSGLKLFAGITQDEQQKLIELKILLAVADRKKCLTVENYCIMLKTLLHIEEHQMKKNIHDYDCDNQKLCRIPGKPHLLSLEVPGLAENRPSLIRGDDLLVRKPGDTVRYKAYIHNVRETTVHLGFHKRFVSDEHPQTQLYSVSFGFNRHTLKTEHQAVELVKKHDVAMHFFPFKAPNSPKLLSEQYDWFEKKILKNEEQQQAVRHILSRTSYPAPYLLFGPPGTGKTSTMVEAIFQIWKTQPKCNVLVAAPSNSAANEVTTRLAGKIPRTDLFRMISISFDFDKVPKNIAPYCNHQDGEYFYPPLATLLQYRILIVTLTAAAKLVNAGVPPEFYSYVFIDESGHATESEVLIPIAGIITSQQNRKTMTGQIVLAGDPKQLGPIIHSKLAESYGFGTSMLERLMENCDVYKKNNETGKYNPTMVTKLLKNFRSHPDILKIPDRMFYDNELIPIGNEMVNLAIDWDALPNVKCPLIFHSVKGKDEREENSPSYFNRQEIDVVVKYLQQLIGTRLKGKKIEQSDIGIVSPYKKQVQKLNQACHKKNWNNILIGSVEQFQGQERLIIIITTVRSTQKLVEHDYRFHLGFLKNPKRFNVAITRAKALVIVVGNPDILQHDQHWGEFIQYCIAKKALAGAPFTFQPYWQNNNNNDLSEDFLKLSLECDSNIDNKELSYEHADFSRGIL
ncbi:armitage [Carabus blaptoides fortunei]